MLASNCEPEKASPSRSRDPLQKPGTELHLQILISNAHVVEARLSPASGTTTEAAEGILFALFDQAAVDRLAAALAK